MFLFEVSLNEENILFGRLTKLLSRKTKFGDFINYKWSGINLEKITNSDGEEVLFSYDSSNRIIKVDFTSLKQYIEYTYKLDEWRINIATYSYKLSSKVEPELTKLKEVQLNYIEIIDGSLRKLMLDSIVDNVTGYSINYTMNSSGTVEIVTIKNKKNEIAYRENIVQAHIVQKQHRLMAKSISTILIIMEDVNLKWMIKEEVLLITMMNLKMANQSI